jgi:uncharacterized membrane protein
MPRMILSKHLVAWLAAFIVLLAIDMLWLGFVAKSFYQQGIGHLMAPEPRLGAAALFYLLYPVGLVIFAVAPGLAGEGVARVALFGALFGFFAYATYDLSNLATLKDWPVGLALLDIAWGTAVSGAAAAAGKWASKLVG